MSDKQETKHQEQQPIGKMSLAEVDAEFANAEATIKRFNESVIAAFEANHPVNVDDLRQLQRMGQRRTKLMLRRIALVVSNPSTQANDLLDKLMKVKVAQA